MNTDEAKKLIRAQLGEDLREKLREIREREPGLNLEQAWQKLSEQNPALLAYAERVEANDWPLAPKPAPFRFIDRPKKSEREFPAVWRHIGAERVEATREE